MPEIRRTAIMKRRFRPIAVGVIVLLIIGSPVMVRLAADWYWFQALGFQSVFLKAIALKLELGVGVGLFAFGFLYANLAFAQRGLVPLPVLVSVRGEEPRVDLTRLLRRLALPASIFLAFLFGIAASSEWLEALRWMNATRFGVTDPVFN